MMEIEKAIQTLGDCMDVAVVRLKNNEEKRTAVYVDLDTLSDFDQALTALREKQEREKGCEYCNDASFVQSGRYVDSDGEICGINNHCINCGRELKARGEGCLQK